MHALRQKIVEINPEVVVCQTKQLADKAARLMFGTNIPVHIIDEMDKYGMWLRQERAVWFGEDEPSITGRFVFEVSYTGKELCS